MPVSDLGKFGCCAIGGFKSSVVSLRVDFSGTLPTYPDQQKELLNALRGALLAMEFPEPIPVDDNISVNAVEYYTLFANYADFSVGELSTTPSYAGNSHATFGRFTRFDPYRPNFSMSGTKVVASKSVRFCTHQNIQGVEHCDSEVSSAILTLPYPIIGGEIPTDAYRWLYCSDAEYDLPQGTPPECCENYLLSILAGDDPSSSIIQADDGTIIIQ